MLDLFGTPVVKGLPWNETLTYLFDHALINTVRKWLCFFQKQSKSKVDPVILPSLYKYTNRCLKTQQKCLNSHKWVTLSDLATSLVRNTFFIDKNVDGNQNVIASTPPQCKWASILSNSFLLCVPIAKQNTTTYVFTLRHLQRKQLLQKLFQLNLIETKSYAIYVPSYVSYSL